MVLIANKYDVLSTHSVNYTIVLKALSPISHIGDNVGNQANLKTININSYNNEPKKVFIYSANAFRNGIIRRKGVANYLDMVGIKVNPTVHQTIFAGGYIDGGTGNDLELDSRIRRFIPPISVLGTAKPKGVWGSKTSQMIPGRLCISDFYLCCQESSFILEPLIDNLFQVDIKKEINKLLQVDSLRDLRPYTEWLTYIENTRMDSLKDPKLSSYLEQPEEDKEQTKQQMIMGNWLLKPGSYLLGHIYGKLTFVEESFLAHTLFSEFGCVPYIGGKSGIGCGRVEMTVYKDGQIIYSSNKVGDPTEITGLMDTYSEYLEENKNQIKDFINT